MSTTTTSHTSPTLRTVPHAAAEVAASSIFAPARDRMLHLARVYPADRLLAIFRANAGLDTRGAEPPGGWEGWGHPNEEPWGEHDYPGQENAQTANLLRGHYAGHFLSMLALAYAGTQEQDLKTKVDDVVSGLAQVQDTLAATGRFSHPGFLAAYGEWQFSRLEGYAPYGEIWAPYYTTHKIMAGLLDAYELAGNSQALEVVTAMAHWVHHRLEKLPAEQIQKMWSLYIAGEYGGMNETLARLAQVTGEQKFLATAQFFDQANLLQACSTGEDILDDMHANQHIPQFIGYIHEYELTGDRRYLDAATGLFDMVVPGRTYAHGGSGESELWGPANTQAGDIGRRNAETCVAYNMLKLARGLFGHTRDPKYMDYYEQAVTNQILGSRKNADSDVSPEVTYMFPVHAGARREFNNIGTCCGGTGLENHVKYQDTAFFTEAGATWVNLYSPATLHAADGGLGLQITGDYPYQTQIRLNITSAPGTDHTLQLRIPGWLAQQGQPRVAVNGEETTTSPVPGTYLPVTRVWRAGDVVDLHFPMRLRAVPSIDDPTVQHLQIGPTVLLARSEDTLFQKLPLTGSRILDASLTLPTEPTGDIEADTAAVLTRLRQTGTVPFGGYDWEPAHSGEQTRYHMYLTADDATVAFAGEDSGVPNRLRHNGQTVLESIWAGGDATAGGFTSREAFLARTGEIVHTARTEGVLSATEAETVLTTAAAADITASGHRYHASIDRQTRPERLTATVSTDADAHTGTHHTGAHHMEAVTWQLPAGWEEITAPPIVTLEVNGTVSSSGWYTTHPQITVTAEHLDAAGTTEGLTVEYQLDEEPWQPYTEPVTLHTEGAHTVRARITDAAGHTNLAERRLRIDTEPPVTTPQVLIMGSGAEIRLRAKDATSGVERVQWEGPGTFWATYHGPVVRALGETEQVIEFAATDVAGNEEPRQRITLPAREG
ncbi:beta-L-arabinofuranosidase domain-containing protein [Nesterenkonia alba]|uniref:beta-L-arabinofuranosidase domain-containing protein n=1 Tax=Nesterenkonia alba TaxID=515814 RepID=UPI0003B58F82|nr:beta-L-arabinofuranosidase domain-containing protein [Nesterenkonia alba]